MCGKSRGRTGTDCNGSGVDGGFLYEEDRRAAREAREYREKVRRLVKVRWGGVLALLAAFLVFSCLPAAVEMDMELYLWAYLVILLVFIVTIILVVASPVFANLRVPDAPDGELIDELDGVAGEVDLSKSWHETVRMRVLHALVAVMVAIVVVANIIDPDPGSIVVTGITLAFLMFLVVFFGTLEVHCTPKALSFYFGFIGRTVPVTEVVSIRPVNVNPLGDFMGWGLRMGTDGSQGYICAGDVGVALHTGDDKRYTITVSDPQGLTDYVRAARKAAGGRR